MKGHLSCPCWATGYPNAMEQFGAVYYVAPWASNLAFERMPTALAFGASKRF